MSKKILYRILYVCLAVLSIYGVARFCHKQTAGFKMSKVLSPLTQDVATLEPSSDEKALLDEILNQKFSYFARGLQSFAFISSDQKYVLKLLNNRYQRRVQFFSFLPKIFDPWRSFHLEKDIQKIRFTFASYQLAFNELKDETALIYLHLHPTACFKNKLTIVDRIGIEHLVDLDQTGFILQKRATLAHEKLLDFKNAKDLPSGKKAIDAILNLIVDRCKRGIHDNDPLIRTNLGFIGDRPIFIDVGPFSKDDRITDSTVYIPEIYRICASLKDWLNKHYPELSPHLDEQLEKVLSSPEK